MLMMVVMMIVTPCRANRWARGKTILTVEERDELVSSALGAKGKSNGREAVDGVEAEQDIVVLE